MKELRRAISAIANAQQLLDLGISSAVPSLQMSAPPEAHAVLLKWRWEIGKAIDEAQTALAAVPTSVDFTEMRNALTRAEADVRVALGLEFYE